MAVARIMIDYANTLTPAVGPVHGLAPAEVERAAVEVAAVVERIESERASGRHRYRDLPKDRSMLKAVQAAVRKYSAKKFENLVVLGIGGSALGNIALQTALNPAAHNLLPAAKRRGPRLFVLDNIDPMQFASTLDALMPQLRRTLFNVISKSGETAETAAQFLIIGDLLKRKLGRNALKTNMLVTTDAQSGTMREIANAEGCDTLAVPDGVGGRFSVLSAVGLFSAGMCGVKIEKLLAGAAMMSAAAANRNITRNPAAMLALLLHAFYVRGKRLHVMFPYAHPLKDMADWYRQLWAESLGKCVDLDGRPTVVGPTPIKALGATDQHSQVQLYREGPNDKVFIFLETEKFARDVKIPKAPPSRSSTSRMSTARVPDALRYLCGASLGKLINAEKRATEYALVSSQRPCLTIRFPQITEETVGQFILLWEAATSIAGYLFGIDPYDQPAVQMGKDFTYALMGRKGYESYRRQYDQAAKPSHKWIV